MANDGKHKRRKRKARRRRTATYGPVRDPRLREPVAPEPGPEPPPLSTRTLSEIPADQDALLGDAEDGLRILAALEAMESLEPQFCDDVAGEASVTIIERATPFDMPLPLDADGAPEESAGGGPPKAPDIDAARHAAYRGPIEEAVVEIYEVPGAALELPGPRREKKGRPVGQRFFKALTEGGNG